MLPMPGVLCRQDLDAMEASHGLEVDRSHQVIAPYSPCTTSVQLFEDPTCSHGCAADIYSLPLSRLDWPRDMVLSGRRFDGL